jgi:hypothetical protein
MKLLYCKSCNDIFNINHDPKICTCGKSMGMYTDTINAIYSGDCIPMGIANNSFLEAVKHPPMFEPSTSIVAFIIPVECKTFKKLP